MGLDVIDVIEGDMASVIGLVIDIIGLVLIMGLVEDIIGLVLIMGLIEDIIGLVFIMGLIEDIIGLVIDIIGLVKDIIGLVIGLVEDIIGLVADIIGLVVIIGLVDIMGPANPMDIIRREFNMFSANLDIMDKTVRIMGDVVIIWVITGMEVPVVMASCAASLRRGVVEPLNMVLAGLIADAISADGEAMEFAIAFAIDVEAIVSGIEEAGIIESGIAMAGSDAIIADGIWDRFSTV